MERNIWNSRWDHFGYNRAQQVGQSQDAQEKEVASQKQVDIFFGEHLH